jgi:hypothetical protein
VIKNRQFTKGQKLFVIIAIFVCGLLFFANGVVFNLISGPAYVDDTIAFSTLAIAIILIVITLTFVIRDKRKSLFTKTQKSNGANSNKESIETSSTILSPVDSQENVDEVEPNAAAVQTANEPDKTPITPLAKSSRKRNLTAILIAIIAGLLLYVNIASFKLITLPEYSMYIALAGATALTVTTITTALIDKRRGTTTKTHAAKISDAIEESNAAPETPDTVPSPTMTQTNADKIETDIVAFETAKVPEKTPAPIAPTVRVFGKRNLFVIIVAFTVGLLFFANAVAFGLIYLPEYAMYAAVAGAAVLAAIALTMILGEKIKVLGSRIKRFVSEPDIQEIINEVKEPDQAPDITSAPVIAQVSIKKVDSYAELLRQFGVQKTTSRLEADILEQEKQLPKKPVIPPTTVLCPACRKEFNLPIYERDYIVDFGRPKRSNLIKRCPHCQTSIPLKRRGVVEEDDIWKD